MQAKKKENLWELLKRLDEEAGHFNMQMNQANRYFDTAASETQKLLQKHEHDLHKTIGKVRKAIKNFVKNEGKKNGDGNKSKKN